MSSEVVHEFEIRTGAVRASVGDFRGRRRLDVRVWVERRDSPGAELIPTPRGLSLPIEYADDLLEAAQAIVAAVASSGRSRAGRRVAS